MEVLMFLGIGFFIWAETQETITSSSKGLEQHKDRVVVAGPNFCFVVLPVTQTRTPHSLSYKMGTSRG